jgi:hypothetical protein
MPHPAPADVFECANRRISRMPELAVASEAETILVVCAATHRLTIAATAAIRSTCKYAARLGGFPALWSRSDIVTL